MAPQGAPQQCPRRRGPESVPAAPGRILWKLLGALSALPNREVMIPLERLVNKPPGPPFRVITLLCFSQSKMEQRARARAPFSSLVQGQISTSSTNSIALASMSRVNTALGPFAARE